MEHPYTFFQAYLPQVTEHNLHVVTAGAIVLLLALGVVMVFPRLRDAKRSVIPDGKFSLLSFFEMLMGMLLGLCEDIIGHGGRKFFPFVGSIFFFIFFVNLIGLIPGFLPPSENWATGAALATISLLAFNYFGFQENGAAYLKHFVAPMSPGPFKAFFMFVIKLLPIVLLNALFTPVELLGMVFRPITLTIRLTMNIFADHQVLNIFSGLVPYVVPCIFLALGIFVSFMQAFIFTLLTVVYISGAVAHEH